MKDDNAADEWWTVETTRRKGGFGSWDVDRTGPQLVYYTRNGAMDWAVKLANLAQHLRVRIKHVTMDYEEVTQ